MKKLISALAALLVLCFGMTGFAQPMPYTVTYNYLNGSLTIEGTTAVNDGMVTLEVLEKGNAFDGALSDEALKICRQTRAENGRYVFEIPFSCTEADTGEYAARLGSQSGDEVTELSLYLEPKENLANAYAGLEGAVSDFDTFSSYLDEHAADLNFGFALIDNGTVSASELKNYYDYVKSNPLRLESESDEQTNSRIFKTYAAAAALNKGAVSDMDRYIDEMYIEDEQFNELYDKYITTSSKQAYFTQKMSGKNIVGTDDFEKAAREALIFATIRYAGGSDDVKNVLTAYDSFIGIGSSMSDTACRGLMGRDFSSIQEIKSNYDALNTSRPATGGGSGGGFGGSGGGSGGWSNTGTGIGGYAAEPITGGDVSETLSVSFDDLDSVPWAAEAILALADKGIVNGVGYRQFDPDSNVTREEFAKLLVCSMGLQNAEYDGNGFTDVSEDDWFCSYVNIARTQGIVKGIGDGLFGVGNSITREDMVTMLYNALRMKGAAMDTTAAAFDDFGEIADYAADAVSALYHLGVVNGETEKTFVPKGTATRAEAAKVIYGALSLLQ